MLFIVNCEKKIIASANATVSVYDISLPLRTMTMCFCIAVRFGSAPHCVLHCTPFVISQFLSLHTPHTHTYTYRFNALPCMYRMCEVPTISLVRSQPQMFKFSPISKTSVTTLLVADKCFDYNYAMCIYIQSVDNNKFVGALNVRVCLCALLPCNSM